MKKIVIFGNCQAHQLKCILSALLPSSEFAISNLSNNQRTGDVKSKQEILSTIKDCDFLLYQPLNSSYGELSEENIKNVIKTNCALISFPYIFNSGVYSLCHAPMATAHNYGMIFGEEEIIKQLQSGKRRDEILRDYQKGHIDFNVVDRFNKSLDIMKQKESSVDIKLVDFIKNSYQNQMLFITHNHPTNILFYEMIKQLIDIVPLKIKPASIANVTCPELPATNCPITPYDITNHGYKFNAHADWLTKGTSLVNIIIDTYIVEQDAEHLGE